MMRWERDGESSYLYRCGVRVGSAVLSDEAGAWTWAIHPWPSPDRGSSAGLGMAARRSAEAALSSAVAKRHFPAAP